MCEDPAALLNLYFIQSNTQSGIKQPLAGSMLVLPLQNVSIWNKLPVNLSSIPRIKPVLSAIAFYQIKFDLICFILLF